MIIHVHVYLNDVELFNYYRGDYLDLLNLCRLEAQYCDARMSSSPLNLYV